MLAPGTPCKIESKSKRDSCEIKERTPILSVQDQSGDKLHQWREFNIKNTKNYLLGIKLLNMPKGNTELLWKWGTVTTCRAEEQEEMRIIKNRSLEKGPQWIQHSNVWGGSIAVMVLGLRPSKTGPVEGRIRSPMRRWQMAAAGVSKASSRAYGVGSDI